MPNRIIKESIRTSYEIDRLSVMAEITFYRLLTYADDYGLFLADPRILKAELFPLKTFTLQVKTSENNLQTIDSNLTTIDSNSLSGDIISWIDELVNAGIIKLYVANSKPYGCFSKWQEHQRVRNSKPKFPKPDKNKHFDSLKTMMQTIDSNSRTIDSDLPRNAAVIQSNPIQSESNILVQDSRESLDDESDFSLPEKSSKKEKPSIENQLIKLSDISYEQAKATKDIVLRATMYCYESLAKQIPDHKTIANAKLKTWYEPMRLLIEHDKKSLEDIKAVWDWVRTDEFWKVNILSTSKFREKFDDLLVKYRSKKTGTIANGYERLTRIEEELERTTHIEYDEVNYQG